MTPAGEWAYLFVDGASLNELERRISLELAKGRMGEIAIILMPSSGKNGVYYYVEVRGIVTVEKVVAIAKACVNKNLGEANRLITRL